MSGALGRACGGAVRRLAAAQRGGGAARVASTWRSADAARSGGGGGGGGEGAASGEEWLRLARVGEPVNPCNSPFHPAVAVGALPAVDAAPRLSVQTAYDPRGMCFGCGPAHPDGLHMSSYRTATGLQTEVTVPEKYQELPGVVSPGILCTLMTCHGNWASSLALMDKAILPRPPLMVAARFTAEFNAGDYAPPDTPLQLTSSVVRVQDAAEPYTVEIAITLRAAPEEGVQDAPVYARGVGLFHKIGAVRSLNG